MHNPERWYDARQTIYFVRNALPRWIGAFMPRMRAFGRMVNQIIWTGTFQGRFEDRAFAIGVFKRHNDEVRREVPADRLLVYDVREGWGPLWRSWASWSPMGSRSPTSMTPSSYAHRAHGPHHADRRLSRHRRGGSRAHRRGDPARVVNRRRPLGV